MDQTTQIKPGILTSEFITTLITQLIGLAVMSGRLSPTDAPVLTQTLISLITGIFMVTTAVVYIWSRYGLKKALIEQKTTQLIANSQAMNTATP